MESSEIERELEELESRAERLRALYEQYFLGIEKLEPQIQRKEVERRIHVLRREQIRNTGLRFKFQTLVQRYNTMQQYWQRVTREIENGTYRRDVVRAAMKFGSKDALTIVGRKRAAQYERLVARQQERLGARKQAPSEQYEEILDDEFVVDVDTDDGVDEVPTPPRHSLPPPPSSSDGVATGVRAGPSDAPPSIDLGPSVSSTSSPGYGLPSGVRAVVPSSSQADNRLNVPQVPLSSADASRRRVAELAAQMKSSPSRSQVSKERPAAPSPADRASSPDFGGLDLDFDDASSKRRRQSSRSMRAVKPDANFGQIALSDNSPAPAPPSSSANRGLVQPAPIPAKSQPSSPGARPGARPLPSPEAASSPLPRQRAELHSAAPSQPLPPTSNPFHGPAPPNKVKTPLRSSPGGLPPVQKQAEKPPPPAAGDSDSGLADQRLRQIYAKYVETKRSANESTAGITYEKLASSLREQAEKLRSKHPSRSIDYEVVIKEGRTILKPVLR